MSRRRLVGILIVCTGCSGPVLRGGADGAPDAGDANESGISDVSLKAGLDGVSDAIAVEDNGPWDLSIETVIDSANTPAADALDSHPACVAYPEAPPDTPSRQTVRFHFASTSASYLVSRGSECLPISIERYGDAGPSWVTTDSYLQILCEGPVPPAPGPLSAVALNQSGGPLLTWDARRLEPHALCVDCSARGWTGASSYPVTLYSRVPVAAGHYRATFAVLDSLPPACQASTDGMTASCTATYGAYGGRPSQIALCPSSRALSVEFDLPASGDVDALVTDAL